MSSRLNINPLTSICSRDWRAISLTEKHEWHHLYTLLKLAEMGAHRRTAKISTEYLAEKMGISQQTASRYLIELERKGWIQRTITPEGSLIKIDDKGTKELQKLHSNLRFLIEPFNGRLGQPVSLLIRRSSKGRDAEGKEYYKKQF